MRDELLAWTRLLGQFLGLLPVDTVGGLRPKRSENPKPVGENPPPPWNGPSCVKNPKE